MQPSIPADSRCSWRAAARCSPPAQQLVNVSWGAQDTLNSFAFLCLAPVAASAEVTVTRACSFYGFMRFQVPDGMEEKRNQSSAINTKELRLQQVHIYLQKSG